MRCFEKPPANMSRVKAAAITIGCCNANYSATMVLAEDLVTAAGEAAVSVVLLPEEFAAPEPMAGAEDLAVVARVCCGGGGFSMT